MITTKKSNPSFWQLFKDNIWIFSVLLLLFIFVFVGIVDPYSAIALLIILIVYLRYDAFLIYTGKCAYVRDSSPFDCYVAYAQRTNNFDVCSKISTKKDQDDCF